MPDYDRLYKPARRRIQPDPLHRNYLQREPFMYGSQLSDVLPLKRPSIHRERPLPESLVSTLVNRRRPPLPRERPITRSMVAEFLQKKREQRERRPEEFSPQSFYGSKGVNRRCSSAGGPRPTNLGVPRRASVSASGGREFSIIQALMEEVIPKSSASRFPTKPNEVRRALQVKQKDMANKLKENVEQHHELGTSNFKSWPASRPASAPFRLCPQNMTPDNLAESLAAKRKSFLRKRPATAPPKPLFHLPLSRISNPPRRSASNSTTPKPHRYSIRRASPSSSSSGSRHSLVKKNQPTSDESRSSSSLSGFSPTPRCSADRFGGFDEKIKLPSSRSSKKSRARSEAGSRSSTSSSSGGRRKKPASGRASKLSSIKCSSSSSDDDDRSVQTPRSSSSSSSSLSSDTVRPSSSSSSSSSSGFESENGGGNIRRGLKKSGKKTGI